MIVIELTAVTDTAGTRQTFYVADTAHVTGPGDDPANVAFAAKVLDPGTIGIVAFANGQAGEEKFEPGQIVLANDDGAFDGWLDYGFDGQPVTIRVGDPSGAYPGDFPVLLTATVATLEASFSAIMVSIRDRQYIFDQPVRTTVYRGDNVLPAGLEGGPDDLKGKPKPRVYGRVFNLAPPCVNTAKLTYQANDGAVKDIPAVYDRGASLTKGVDYATSALLQAATPSAGGYATCFAEGYFRLGSSPAGLVTCDVVQGQSASDRTAAQILYQLAAAAGSAL